GSLGEIISVPLNVNAMTWRTCPAATELETVVIDWLRQWLGLPDEFGGVLYDTASVGIMHALAAAREEAAPSTRKLGLINRDLPRFRIYTSDEAHSAAEKAAITLGIGEENVQRVETDADFRIDVNALRETIARDVRHNFKPLAVIATVGTTSSASVDPVPEIAKICREQKMWLHIDGAYGGAFAMVPEYKWASKGGEMADSIVINPHKTLFVPLDFSVLYVRDAERLRRVFTLVPEVLRGDTVEGEKNYMDYGIQLGRRFRALKAWVIWRSLGREGIVARLREQIRLANLLAGWIKSDDRFDLAAPVSMGVICFRFVGPVAGVVDPGPGSPTPATTDNFDNLNSEKSLTSHLRASLAFALRTASSTISSAMMKLLRRHKDWLMIVIAILAIPFVFYFVQRPDYGAMGRGDVGQIYGRKLTQLEIDGNARLGGLAQALGMSDFWESFSLRLPGNAGYGTFAVNLIVLRHEAQRLGLRPSASELADVVRSLPAFQGESGFDMNKFSNFVRAALGPMGLGEEHIEQLVQDELCLNEIKRILAAGI